MRISGSDSAVLRLVYPSPARRRHPMDFLQAAVLFLHLFTAVIFVGGSFFMTLVVVPASRLITEDESQRTQIVGKIARTFGRVSIPALLVLVFSGLYNLSWYIPLSDLLTTYYGRVLTSKIVAVGVLLVLVFVHNAFYGMKTVQLAKEGQFEELRNLRKRSRLVSYANLTLMVITLALAAALQLPA